MADLTALKVSDLKKMLYDHDLPTKGKKKQLIHRLKTFLNPNLSKEKDQSFHLECCESSSSSSISSKSFEQNDVNVPEETTCSTTTSVQEQVSFSFRFPVLLEDTKKGAATLSGLGILIKTFWISTIGPILGQKQL